ncbi:hypothetical protein SASPL_140473 [Salvia splendens]|uniref:Uncharacterized protein n=1 Tax=Salvia splendens TaxID=180675 RepID=A0A8X8WNW3_SALSN|nr:hypothetical protein SASPL_140473 [Salvia splendens]
MSILFYYTKQMNEMKVGMEVGIIIHFLLYSIIGHLQMASKYGSGNSSSSKQKEKEKESGESSSLVAVGAAAVGVAAVAWWGLSSLFGSSDEKMMKAPGKKYSIPRKDFDRDPAEWFRNNRSK